MGLRVLLTGEPKVGKSTIIQRSLASVKDTFGFWTTELQKNEQRYGFEVQDNTGRTVLLASVHLSTPDQVGRYHVDVKSFDQFLQKLNNPTPSELIYVDEIGRMQTLSSGFRALLDDLMRLPNMMIGTIAKEDYEPIIKRIKDDAQTILVEVSAHNRDDVLALVQAVGASHRLVADLGPAQYDQFVVLARSTTDLTLLYKLFHNTIAYVTNGQVIQKSRDTFEVRGFTSEHHLHTEQNRLVCDCPVYHQKQLCSHAFAVQLARAHK